MSLGAPPASRDPGCQEGFPYSQNETAAVTQRPAAAAKTRPPDAWRGDTPHLSDRPPCRGDVYAGLFLDVGAQQGPVAEHIDQPGHALRLSVDLGAGLWTENARAAPATSMRCAM